MKIHEHNHTAPGDHPYNAILARTEATIGGRRFVLVDFSPATHYAKGERKVGREVYRIEDGLEIHIGYLSLSAEAAFERDLTRWLGDVNTRRYLRSGRELGAFKTSMLQDVEANKPLEIDALVGAVRELGQITSTPTPHTDALLGLVRLMARTRGLY